MIDYKLEYGKTRNNVREYEDYKIVISIVTPAWNSTDKIFQLANCILNQTYPYYEWLIIDDGSTNKDSLKYYDEVAKMDKRIKVLHKKNEGLSKTRDYGVKHSSKESEYIVFIDDDDLLNPTFLECAYYSMTTNKEASWCYCDVVNFEGQESTWQKKFSSETMKHENLLVSQAMIKKEAFYEAGGFKLEGNGYYEDWIFWLKLLAKGHFPIHMSYYGFWYRRKKESGQLKLARSNHKRNMHQIKEYADKIQKEVKPIEYPRENYNWDGIPSFTDNIIIPNYQKDNRKNILVIVPWMVMGGADKFNLDLFRLIDKEKYRITLVCTQPTEYVWRQQFEQVCDEVFDLSTFIDRKYWAAFISYLIDSRKIDLIFNTNSQFGYAILPFLKSKYPNIPIMDYIHMEEWYNRNGGYSRDSAAVGSVISKTLFCNQNSEKILVDYFNRDKNSVGTVYIGVDTDKFDPSKYNRNDLINKYKIPTNKTIVSLIARIDYQKRPFLMMEIIKKALIQDPNLFFVVAGDGPLLEKITSIAKSLNIKNILFLGKTDKPDEIYAISDITLNCSIKEGLALTSYESLAMGIPVVSSDVGGQKELIDDSVGVIVPCFQSENDILDFNYSDEEIDAYVKGILKIKKDLKKYKDKCRSHVVKKFSLNNMKTNMEKEISYVIDNYKYDDSLVKHSDICLELINLFLLSDREQYNWLIREYNRKVYGDTQISNHRFLYKFYDLAAKLHIPEESELAYKYMIKFLKQFSAFFKAIVYIPYLIIKFIVDFIILEYKRIKRIIKRKLVK